MALLKGKAAWLCVFKVGLKRRGTDWAITLPSTGKITPYLSASPHNKRWTKLLLGLLQGRFSQFVFSRDTKAYLWPLCIVFQRRKSSFSSLFSVGWEMSFQTSLWKITVMGWLVCPHPCTQSLYAEIPTPSTLESDFYGDRVFIAVIRVNEDQ